jgi:hypothetical protein
MFQLLSRVLLWLLLGTIVYSLFQRFYPNSNYLGRVIVIFLLAVLALSLFNPTEPAVASLLRVISFPLKPLGASILLLIFAAQRMKGGGIDKPGGQLVGWALAILLIASTPAVAYLLERAPIASNPTVGTSGTLVASLPKSPGQISDVVSNPILSDGDLGKVTVAFNSLDLQAPLLLQTPQEVRSRGLRIEDFFPNAEALQVTTRVWENYLNQILGFLRPASR